VFFQNKMATSRKKISLESAIEFCLNSDDSDVDSSVGGFSSDEQEELDNLLLNQDYDNTSK